MTVYILFLYNRDDLNLAGDIGGIYTSKEKLIKDLKAHIDELGSFKGTIDEHAKNDFRNFMAANAYIVCKRSNGWNR